MQDTIRTGQQEPQATSHGIHITSFEGTPDYLCIEVIAKDGSESAHVHMSKEEVQELTRTLMNHSVNMTQRFANFGEDI